MKPNGMLDRFYISGPMASDPDFRRKFDECEQWLWSHNYTPYNPAWMEYGDCTSFTRKEMLALDISAISHCDALILLPGWERATGCKVEVTYALACKIPIFFYHPDRHCMDNVGLDDVIARFGL